MSTRLGPFATIAARVEQLQKCNSRIQRILLKIGTNQETADLHSKIAVDRDTSLRLALEIKELLEHAPNQPQRVQYAQELQKELERFKVLSEDIKQRDEKQNKQQQQQQQQQNNSRANKKAGGYNESLLDSQQPDSGDGLDILEQIQMTEEESQKQQQDIVDHLLLTEEQHKSIDIEQLEQRKQEIFKIEQDVQTIAGMFKDLQQLVHEQGEQLDTIEETIITVQTNTEQAYTELETAEEYQIASSRNLRWVAVLGAIALIAVAIVILIIYNKNSKKKD